jgi:thiamine pyrophosphokinase
VRKYYADRGVPVTQDHGQENTDFSKAIELIKSTRGSLSRREVLILGSLAGRVDQGLGLLHEIMREELRDPGLHLWLFSEFSVSFILRKGHSVVQRALSDGCFTRMVGIVPVFGPAIISTSGLKWDVENWATQMGHRVSTSNYVLEDDIRIETDMPVLFTIQRSSNDRVSDGGPSG